MAEPRVKGVSFRAVDTAFLELRGEAARKRARELMVPELSETYRNGLMLAASWYPISWYRSTLQSFRQATGDGLELIRQIGRRSMELDMTGVYKQLLVRFVSPQTMLAMTAKMFSTYYDTGKLEVLEKRAGFVRVMYSGCTGWDGNLFAEIVGASQGMLEISGAKDVRLRMVQGGRDGDTSLELEGRWT